jgi:ribonuclease BN (tRNA processing enzyme)
MLKLTVVGCGDAFGSGGRLQTCFHVEGPTGIFLIDCGATAMIGMHALGLDPDRVGTVVLSHLHGDHYSGLVWWLIHAHHVTRRKVPMTIVGPVGTQDRLAAASEALFPGSWAVPRRFSLEFIEYEIAQPVQVAGLSILPFEGRHPSGALSAALRIEVGDTTLAFSGDTEWVEDLVPCANGADLYISECYGFEAGVPYHLNWQTLSENLDRLGAKQILLTHMNTEMLAKRDTIQHPDVFLAEDGLVVEI